MQLFSGATTAYGVYRIDPSKTRADGKAEGQAVTLRGVVTEQLWEDHLAGRQGVGIIPIREDSSASWGAIDVDYYDNLAHSQLVARLAQLKLPLFVCRSKSGGAHLILFLTEPVPAGVLQSKLRQLSAGMGFGGSEVFPKQTQLRPEKNDVGNWLNMPYFAGEQTTRYAVGKDGKALGPETFLDLAEASRVTPAQLKLITVTQEDAGFAEGPPCLQHLASTGVPSGQRNNALFAMATYARKRWPDAWEPYVEEFNNKYMNPPLTSREVLDVIKHVSAKDYSYRCGEPPIKQFCDNPTCKIRKYGVGTANPGRLFTALSKVDLKDEPRWILDVEGGHGRVEVPTFELMRHDRLAAACLEQVNLYLPFMKRVDWDSMMADLVANVTLIETSEDEREELSRVGQFRELLYEFATNYIGHRGPEELYAKRCWNNGEGRVLFRLGDFEEFLARRKFVYDRSWIALRLKELDVYSTVKRVGKNTIRVRSMQELEEPPVPSQPNFEPEKPF